MDNASSNVCSVWNDDDDVDLAGRMLKNLSYDGSYHQKYYYPQVVSRRIDRREEKEEQDMFVGCDPIPRLVVDSKGRITIQNNTPGTLNNQAGNTCHKAHTSWYLNPTNAPYQQEAGDPEQTNPDSCCTQHHAGEVMASSPVDTGQCTSFGLLDTSGSNDSGFVVKSKPSTESVTSEDSVFSEDYTSVVDDLNVDMLPSKPAAGGDCAESEEVDSSFSSNRSSCSSTSTLEADGKEDGGPVVEDDNHKDKVIHKEPLHSRKKCTTNLNLDIHTPNIEVREASLPREMEGNSSGPQNRDADDQETSDREANTPDSSFFYEDREFEFLKSEPVRRSTSLKTYKTPPGTPSRKKAVRFADALGLDLESVRHILNLEEPPVVPKSAMNDLHVGIEKEQVLSGVKYLSALFSQPGADPAFVQRVSEGKVALENCVVNDKDMTLSGTVRVANISYHKKVLVRYTTNSWLTSDDITASYVQNSNDGPTDRFSFTLTVPTYFAVGQRLEFAIMYGSNGSEFWDNNYGKNYAIECYAKAAPSCESDNTWMHFL